MRGAASAEEAKGQASGSAGPCLPAVPDLLFAASDELLSRGMDPTEPVLVGPLLEATREVGVQTLATLSRAIGAGRTPTGSANASVISVDLSESSSEVRDWDPSDGEKSDGGKSEASQESNPWDKLEQDFKEERRPARGASAVGASSTPAGRAAGTEEERADMAMAPKPGDDMPPVPAEVEAAMAKARAVAAVLKRPATSSTEEVPPWRDNKKKAAEKKADSSGSRLWQEIKASPPPWQRKRQGESVQDDAEEPQPKASKLMEPQPKVSKLMEPQTKSAAPVLGRVPEPKGSVAGDDEVKAVDLPAGVVGVSKDGLLMKQPPAWIRPGKDSPFDHPPPQPLVTPHQRKTVLPPLAGPPPLRGSSRGSAAVRTSSAPARSAAAKGTRLATVEEGAAEAEQEAEEVSQEGSGQTASRTEPAAEAKADKNSSPAVRLVAGPGASLPPTERMRPGTTKEARSVNALNLEPGAAGSRRSTTEDQESPRVQHARALGTMERSMEETLRIIEELHVQEQARPRPPPDDGRFQGDVHNDEGRVVGQLVWMEHRQTYYWRDVFEDEAQARRPAAKSRGRFRQAPEAGVQGRAWPPPLPDPQGFDVIGQVNRGFHCPVYTQPYPNGFKTGEVYVSME